MLCSVKYMLYICSVKPINNTRLPPLGMEEGMGESSQDQCRCIRLRHRPQGEGLLEEVRRAEPHGLR